MDDFYNFTVSSWLLAPVSVIIVVQFGPRAPSAQVVRVTLSFTLVGWVDATAVDVRGVEHLVE